MSVFKRRNSPYYYCSFEFKGRRISRSTGAASRRDAEAFERALREQVALEARSAPRTMSCMTLDQATGRYWIEHGRRLADARNVQRWLSYIVRHLDPALPIGELSASHVTECVTALRANKIGEIAINRTITTLQGVHNRAAKKWEIPVRVIDWRAHKVRERPRVRNISIEEAQSLLAALPVHIRRVVLFLLLTGVRKREGFELTWDRVRFETSSMIVRVKGGYEREVALSRDARHVLEGCPRVGERVFDTTNWRKHFDAGLVASGITNFRWHDCRHTFATLLGQSGAPLEVIKTQLGHSSISVTQKYRHVVQSEVHKALQQATSLSHITKRTRLVR